MYCAPGSIIKGFYGVSNEIKAECKKRLGNRLLGVVEGF